MHLSFFITEGHLGSFQLWAIMNFMMFPETTINFHIKISLEHRASLLKDKYLKDTCFMYEKCMFPLASFEDLFYY